MGHGKFYMQPNKADCKEQHNMTTPVITTDFPALILKHRGKVRDMYEHTRP